MRHRSFHFAILALLVPAAAIARPTALWVSDPVRPGETVMVFGDSLSGCQSVSVARQPDGPSGSPSGARPALQGMAQVVRPALVRPHAVDFSLPTGALPGLFHATLSTPQGAVTVWVNRPQLLWAQGDVGPASTPGGSVRVFGKCFTSPGHTGSLRIEGPDHRATSLSLVQAAEFAAEARLPSSLPPGEYQLRLHAGVGGQAGWSDAIAYRIEAPRSAPGLKLSVTDLGARGDDAEDDTDAVEAGLNRLETAGGGTLFFPRCRYVLHKSVNVPRGVTLAGAGRDTTALCWPDTTAPPKALVAGLDHFTVQDLTLYATNHLHGITADQATPTAGYVRILRVCLRMNPYRGHLTEKEVAQRLAVQQTLSSGGGDSLQLGGPGVEVADCDISGGGRSLYLRRGRGASIHDNTLTNGRWGWYCISGSDGVVFERNRLSGGDLMSTGGGLNCLDGSLVSQNVYYAHNTLRNMFGWDREAMTSDAGGGAYYGRILAVDGPRLTLASDPTGRPAEWVGGTLFVLGGNGEGQYRRITAFSGRDVTLDRPFEVAPDKSSVVTISLLQRNYLFVGNSFEDAGIAIQLYGAAVGHIASGNVSNRTGGFHNFGMNYDGVQPSWFVQWLDNRITDGNVYGGGHDQAVAVGEAHIGVYALPPGIQPEAPVTLCGIVRRSVLEGNAHLGVGGTPESPMASYPYVQEVVLEGNHVANAACGLLLSEKGVEGLLQHSNRFTGVGTAVATEQPEAVAARRLLVAVTAKALAERLPLVRVPASAGQRRALFEQLTLQGTARLRDEPGIGRVLVLDGAGWAELSGTGVLNLEDFTLSLLVRPDALPGRFGLVTKRGPSQGSPVTVTLQDGRIGFEATDTDGKWTQNFFAESGTLLAGVWQRVVVVRRGGRDVTLYLNGREVGHKAIVGHAEANSSAIRLGWEQWGGNPPLPTTPGIFRGELADFSLWPRAFAPAEVTALSAGTTP